MTASSQASRPTRARGLKLIRTAPKPMASTVAPHAGAWIETGYIIGQVAHTLSVAPHAGAWIETNEDAIRGEGFLESRPTRARGLKRNHRRPQALSSRRAPRGRVD